MHQQTEQWFHQEEGALVVYAFSFLDVKTLLQKETVSKTWRKLSKQTLPSKAFKSRHELKDAITKYCRYESATMEQIAVHMDIPWTPGMFLR
jgi:hypothetical protein